jgi:ABC-type transport system involved in multi-copper enzyme maturation permease subunit
MIDLALFRAVLMAEWTKLRSVRSTYWSILIAILLGIGLSAAISAGAAASYSGLDLHDRLTFDATAISTSGLFFAQLALGVFAIVTMSAEYSTGSIRATMAAVPKRGYVLAAKAVMVAGVSLVVAVGVAFAAFEIGQLIFSRHGLDVSLSDPGVARAVLGSGLYIAGLVLFALGLATIIRHTAGAITALVALVFIIPIVSNLLPTSLQHDVSRYLPANAGSAITATVKVPELLSPWAGYGVFLAWAASALGIGWYLLRTRDV